MNKHLIAVIVACVVALVTIYFISTPKVIAPTPPDSASSNADETLVREAVVQFGTNLKMVTLLAPTTERKAAMEQYYGPYVAPELLAQWTPEGADALGRYTSSPWPDSIDIVEVTQTGNQFVVEGNVVEVVNSDSGNPVPAAVYPVTLTLERRGDQWLIVSATKGAYSELPRSQTIVGYWECLPSKDTSGPQTLECALGIAVDQN